jgi:hypothetical protein
MLNKLFVKTEKNLFIRVLRKIIRLCFRVLPVPVKSKLQSYLWRSEAAVGYFSIRSDTGLESFLAYFTRMLRKHSLETNKLEVVEIGTGNAYLIDRIEKISDLKFAKITGIDLNEKQIQANRQQFPQLSFFSGDAIQWINRQKTAARLFITNHTLTCFEQHDLDQLFRALSKHPDQYFFLYEPIVYDSVAKKIKVESRGDIAYSHDYLSYFCDDSRFHVYDYEISGDHKYLVILIKIGNL